MAYNEGLEIRTYEGKSDDGHRQVYLVVWGKNKKTPDVFREVPQMDAAKACGFKTGRQMGHTKAWGELWEKATPDKGGVWRLPG